MRYDGKLNQIVQTAVMLNQTGDNVMSSVEAIEKRLRKGGVATEVWLTEQPVSYDKRRWMLGYARFDGRYRLAVREVTGGPDPGYATPLKHSPRLLRLRAAATIGGLLDRLYEAVRAHAEEAAAVWSAKGVPYAQGIALMHGDEEAQLKALRIFDGLGAAAAAQRVRRSLLDAGVRVSRGVGKATRSNAAGLTARQSEVLDLLAVGLSNSEIADRLFVSDRTVENHVRGILKKLGVANRQAAVAAAHERGILATT